MSKIANTTARRILLLQVRPDTAAILRQWVQSETASGRGTVRLARTADLSAKLHAVS